MDARLKPEKSYKNAEFLNSDHARTIRMLCEYHDPERRFAEHNIKDIVVFFGSARAFPTTIVEEMVREHERALETGRGDPKEATLRLRLAQNALRIARYYDEAVELARMLTHWALSQGNGQRFVITTGGGPGIMEAANRGARQAGGRSVGLNISLPHEQYVNPYVDEDLSFEFHYFFMRKFWFMYLAKALVAFPGGFGTFDELFETLTLIQTNKTRERIPIIIYGTDYWKKVVDFDALVEWGTISPRDMDLIHFSDTPQDAFDYLKDALEKSVPAGELGE